MEHYADNDYRDKMFITVEELSRIMRISRSMAYKYVESNECPFYREQVGKRIIIPTKTFFDWYDSLTNE
ncbi:MAG: helix-turn-helix domain-containing protein [Lachnospiraceae bacterium]|nr:helix-turn-helix domain-containing protein [Lachnospiraceae bacterium]